MEKIKIKEYFDSIAENRDKWKNKGKYYHKDIEKLAKFLIPENASVLEIGCATGDILAYLNPKNNLGIDLSEKMVNVAKRKYPHLNFEVMDTENLSLNGKYDYIIMSDVVGFLEDIQKSFLNVKKISHNESRFLITYYNYLWEPVVRFAEFFGFKMKAPIHNWLSDNDVENLLYLSGFEIVKRGERLLFPKYIPLFSAFCNKYLAKMPFVRKLCLVKYVVARVVPDRSPECGVTVLIPARNEKGNIEDAVRRVPQLGTHTEIMFVEGNSTDDTLEEIKRIKEKYPEKDIKILVQDGKGKGDAVRKGFDAATGDILMILDADLTVRPEELPKFYEAIVNGKADFVNGSRLVYQLENQSMRLLNIFGNKFFSLMFSWLLDQRLKDTLCGTKVLRKHNYQRIKEGRKFFGDFDPFGDFDLLFGAAKLNLKIVDLPIRYQARTYGTTNISRFKHGWLLLKMCVFAMKKIKFI